MTVPMSEKQILAELASFDFIDVGANKGDSFRFGLEQLGGTKGLALDINPKAVSRLNEAGMPALLRDCRHYRFEGSNFRFAILSHILEHMDAWHEVSALVSGVARNVRDFVFIRQPFFDEDAYLSTKGIKTVGANLSYHPLHVHSQQYAQLFMALGFQDFAIYGSERLRHSHQSGHLIDSRAPLDTKGWKRDPATKPVRVDFERPVFQELVMVLRLSQQPLAGIVEAAVPKRSLLYKAARAFEPLPD